MFSITQKLFLVSDLLFIAVYALILIFKGAFDHNYSCIIPLVVQLYLRALIIPLPYLFKGTLQFIGDTKNTYCVYSCGLLNTLNVFPSHDTFCSLNCEATGMCSACVCAQTNKTGTHSLKHYSLALLVVKNSTGYL